MGTRPPPSLRRIVCGPDAASRIEEASRWLVARGAATEVGIIGATTQAAADLARSVGREVGASFGWRRFTLKRFAWELAGSSLAQRGLSPVGSLVVEAVSARVVHAAAAAGRLGRFAPIADRPGLPRALARSFSELRLEGRTPATISDGDLSLLLANFEEELRKKSLADRAELFATATEIAHAGHRVLGVPLLFLDVPVETAREMELVRAVLRRTPDALFTFPEGDERTRRHLATLDVPIELRRPGAKTSLQRLQSGLFAEFAEAPLATAGVDVFSAPGESRECVEIARLIHREAAAGVPFDRMAILLRSPAQYRAHIEESFRRASIPAHFARGTTRPDPAGRAFLSLLRCAAEGLSAARFAEFLSLGEVPDATDKGAPPSATPAPARWVPVDDELAPIAGSRPDRETSGESLEPDATTLGPVVGGTLRAPRFWEKLLVDAAVIGGLERWQKRLAGLSAQLELELEEVDDPDDATALLRRREKAALEGLRDFALPLLADLAALPKAAEWREWIDALGALATRSLRHPERVLATLAELEPMAEVGPVELAEVRIVLEARLPDVIVPPSERRMGHVFVASTDEARGLAFDVVFVPGLAEKLFPRKVSEDPILPDPVRETMGLPTNAERSAAERLALRVAVGAASRRVVVSYPRLDLEQSRPRTPSFYGLEVLRAAEGRLPGFDELARRANVTGAPKVGWPAPSDPKDAIDFAEHDLALLDAVLRLPEGESVGMARYLLSANVHLGRALRARGRRWVRGWNVADGLVQPDALARPALARHELSARSYSPTGLQNYAACPYRFVLQAIHKLAPREDPAPLEELDPLQKGSLVHETLFALHVELRKDGLLPVTDANLETARAHLDRVLEEVARRYEDDLAPAIPRVWDDAVAGIRADLREWLRRASLDAAWRPVFFELSFGLPAGARGNAERDANSSPEPARLDCGVQLRGSIDLVEAGSGGPLRATDYKTGKVRAEPGVVIGGGAVLQPVFYALALEKLLPRAPVSGGRLYYCTATGEFTEVVVPLDDEARRAASVVAKTVGQAVASAFLPAAPGEKACQYCDYLRVCGPYEEERVKRKKQDDLAPLHALRKER
jgi:CRISPR/Cas system-associated exonuclease Cas4 (RecB family)